MNRKIKRTPQAALSIKGAFDEFVVAQTAKGFSESTIKNYHSHFRIFTPSASTLTLKSHLANSRKQILTV